MSHFVWFVMGAAHPLTGLDHVFAMIAVGIWGATAGGRALWVWPAAFITAMVTGFVLGVSGIGLPVVEPFIAASIVVIGLCIAFAARAPVWFGALLTGSFAVFHGHAHGTEAVGIVSDLAPYIAGFGVATAALHGTGIWLGLLLNGRAWETTGTRIVGGLVTLAGITQLGLLA